MDKNFPITGYNLEEMNRYQAIFAALSVVNDFSIHNFLNGGTLMHGTANLLFFPASFVQSLLKSIMVENRV